MRWWQWILVALALAALAALATAWGLREADVIRWGAVGVALDRLDAVEDREDQFTVVNTQVPQGPLPSRERREDAWEFVQQYLPQDEQGMSYEEWRDATVRELAETLRRQGVPEAKAFDLAFERLDRLTPQQMYDTLLAPGSRDFCITYTVPEGLQERCKPIFVDDDGPSEESLPTFHCFLSAVIGEPLPACWR